MSKVKVINNKDRYFNWARKWQVIEIDSIKLDYYKKHWFSLIEEKQNILKNPAPTIQTFEWIDDIWTIPELKEKLEHFWINYDTCKLKADFQKLLSETLKNPPSVKKNDEIDTKKDVEALKTQLISEKIVEVSEIEWKTDAEIIEIATNNWLID